VQKKEFILKKGIFYAFLFFCATFFVMLLIVKPGIISKQKIEIRTIVDMAGVKVQIPYEVQRVVTAMYPIATQLVILLESQSKLAGISDFDVNDTMKKIFPRIESVYRPLRHGNGDVTVEEIMKIKPDVLFLSKHNPQNANLAKLGIPAVFLTLESPKQLMQGITLVGEILQKKERSLRVINYFKEKLDYIYGKTAKINSKKRVYYAGPNMLSTAGGDFYQNYIIEYAGGINVAQEYSGGWSNISVEQLIAWNPDFIFIGNYGTARVKNFFDDKRLGVISAVRMKEVYKSPHYIGGWDVPNPESILGIMWLANKLYPNEISFDMPLEIKKFYAFCYGYTPDDNDI